MATKTEWLGEVSSVYSIFSIPSAPFSDNRENISFVWRVDAHVRVCLCVCVIACYCLWKISPYSWIQNSRQRCGIHQRKYLLNAPLPTNGLTHTPHLSWVYFYMVSIRSGRKTECCAWQHVANSCVMRHELDARPSVGIYATRTQWILTFKMWTEAVSTQKSFLIYIALQQIDWLLFIPFFCFPFYFSIPFGSTPNNSGTWQRVSDTLTSRCSFTFTGATLRCLLEQKVLLPAHSMCLCWA